MFKNLGKLRLELVTGLFMGMNLITWKMKQILSEENFALFLQITWICGKTGARNSFLRDHSNLQQ